MTDIHVPVYELDDVRNKNIKQLYFDIGRDCNMDCSYCYNQKYQYPIPNKTADDVEYVINGLRDMGNTNQLSIMILGGEPTIHDELINIIRLTEKHKKVEFLIATNGLRLGTDEEYAHELLSACNKHVMFIIDWTFLDNLELGGDLYKQMPDFKYKALKKLEEYGMNRNVINVIVDHNTDKKALKDFFDMAGQLDNIFSYISFNNIIGSNFTTNNFIHLMKEIGVVDSYNDIFNNVLLSGYKFAACDGKNCCIKFKYKKKFIIKFTQFDMNSCWFRRYVLPNNKLTEGINYLTIREIDDLNITNIDEILV